MCDTQLRESKFIRGFLGLVIEVDDLFSCFDIWGGRREIGGLGVTYLSLGSREYIMGGKLSIQSPALFSVEKSNSDGTSRILSICPGSSGHVVVDG